MSKFTVSVEDVLDVITGDEHDFEGCEDPDYTPINREMESDELSSSGDSDCGQSNYLDKVPL